MEKAGDIVNAILIISAIFSMVGFFLVAYMIRFNKKQTLLIAEKEKQALDFQQQLLQSQIEVQETTYSVLSKELHDNVGQLLSTAKMLIGLAERDLQKPPDTLLTANATLGEAISELRSLSRSLDKEWLEQFSFTENINAVISRINAGKVIQAKFVSSTEINLLPGEQIILFRIVQEAIQNAIKHAAPSEITVAVFREEKNIVINVENNGSGFSKNEVPKGMGLTNMQHRTHLLGGKINWDSSLINGTGVTITLLPKKSDI